MYLNRDLLVHMGRSTRGSYALRLLKAMRRHDIVRTAYDLENVHDLGMPPKNKKTLKT
jgi:hypothetical protein